MGSIENDSDQSDLRWSDFIQWLGITYFPQIRRQAVCAWKRLYRPTLCCRIAHCPVSTSRSCPGRISSVPRILTELKDHPSQLSNCERSLPFWCTLFFDCESSLMIFLSPRATLMSRDSKSQYFLPAVDIEVFSSPMHLASSLSVIPATDSWGF